MFKKSLLALAFSVVAFQVSAVPETSLATMYPAEISTFWQEQVKTGTMKTPDGVQLAYAYVVPSQSKYALLLIQGRTEAYQKYHELYYDLATQGIAVFSLDHRGQGLSARELEDPHKGHITDFRLYSQDQNQFITEVVNAQTDLPLNLLAHSMGGAVAVQLLTQQPTLFQRAVLTSPMIAPNTTVAFSEQDGCYLAAAFDWTCADCYAGFVAQPYPANQDFADNILTSSTTRYQLFRDLYKQQPQLQLGGPTWSWLSQACDVADQMPVLARQIKTPVLMLQSGSELAVSNTAQQQFCQELGPLCAEGKVQAFAGAKHELLFESDSYRDLALQKILAFVQQDKIKAQ
ncbi:alpha/beta fold hydrolase [Rheinheimera sp. F8]|uniref:alpha/beta fold hydrolase n=1 Tax=Rheinheimera sp. F8 TaxID=1763998 RepID=UPI000A868011|nr:alpha/beta fold hydrolase [Rheinheimera sp. F8]